MKIGKKLLTETFTDILQETIFIIPEARYIEEEQILLQNPFLIQLLHNLKEVRKMMKLRKNEVQEKESNTVRLRLLTT